MCVQTFDLWCLQFRCVFSGPVIVTPRPSTGSSSHASINQVLLYWFISPDKTFLFFFIHYYLFIFYKEKEELKSAVPFHLQGGCREGRGRGQWRQQTLLEKNSPVVFCRMPELLLRRVCECQHLWKAVVEFGADGGAPGWVGVEGGRIRGASVYLPWGMPSLRRRFCICQVAKVTAAAEMGRALCPSFFPLPKKVSTSQYQQHKHNVGELRGGGGGGGTGILAHVGATTTTTTSKPNSQYPLDPPPPPTLPLIC